MCDPAAFDSDHELNDDGISRFLYRSGSVLGGYAFVRTAHGTEIVSGVGTAFHAPDLRERAEELVVSGHLSRAGRDSRGNQTYLLTYAGWLALYPQVAADLLHRN